MGLEFGDRCGHGHNNSRNRGRVLVIFFWLEPARNCQQAKTACRQKKGEMSKESRVLGKPLVCPWAVIVALKSATAPLGCAYRGSISSERKGWETEVYRARNGVPAANATLQGHHPTPTTGAWGRRGHPPSPRWRTNARALQKHRASSSHTEENKRNSRSHIIHCEWLRGRTGNGRVLDVAAVEL